MDEYNAQLMRIFVPPGNNILALPEPLTIFVLLDIVLTLASSIDKEEKKSFIFQDRMSRSTVNETKICLIGISQ